MLKLLFCDIGSGDAKLSNWYFNNDKDQCTAFLFKGSEGNANRFETQEQCERHCGAFKNQVIELVLPYLYKCKMYIIKTK